MGDRGPKDLIRTGQLDGGALARLFRELPTRDVTRDDFEAGDMTRRVVANDGSG